MWQIRKHLSGSLKTDYFNHKKYFINKIRWDQECIPVGCVPSAAVAAGGMYPSVHWQGGVSQHALGSGVCIPACTRQGGICPWGCLPKGCVCPEGVSAWEGVFSGVCLPGGGCLPDACENIALQQLLLWTVTMSVVSLQNDCFISSQTNRVVPWTTFLRFSRILSSAAKYNHE